jgi:two-component system alkaline phosphatase synthesis response regulator PhoP
MLEQLKNKRVLVIDDDQDVLAYLETWLSDQGFIVETAHDGNEAFDKLKANKPDLITLDIVMPQKTGVKFYREIKKSKEYANIPVIIITGLQSEFENFISHRRSAPPPDGYISKPFEQEELLKTINAVMGKIFRNTMAQH